MKKKTLVVWNRVGHYHNARLQSLCTILGKDNLFVADLGSNDLIYKWEENNGDYNHFILSDKNVEEKDIVNRQKNFINLIDKYSIDTIALSGYGSIDYLLFIIISKIKRKKIILFAESWYKNNWLFDQIKSLFLSYFIDRFFVSGTKARDHFSKRLKIPNSKIKIGYSVVDNEHFWRRNTKGEPPISDKYLLTVSRYSIEKNLDLLIKAYKESMAYKKFKLVIIGDGPHKEHLKELIGLDFDNIILTGWKRYDELPLWYQGALGFILPSTFEPWGLVVNEALAAGLPVIISDKCGCTPDLVSNENTFSPTDVDDIRNKIDELIEGPYSNEAKFDIASFSTITWAKTMGDLINNV